MFTINNPDDAEKRQNVKPLTVEDEKHAIDILNAYIKSQNTMLNGSAEEFVQRLIHNYENYRYFFEVVGGWDGLNKLQELELIIAIKDWTETTESKNGFIDTDWNYKGVNLDDYELIYVLEQDKFYNPTKALFKKKKYHNPVITVLKKVIETIKKTMIQANELRIGNYVNCTYIVEEHNEEKDEWSDIAHTVIGKVTAIDSVNLTDHKIWVETTDCIEEFEKIETIPLTEDILLRCGWGKSDENEYCNNVADEDYVYIYNIALRCFLIEFHGGVLSFNVDYLHQLQNLYFSLTGEELYLQP